MPSKKRAVKKRKDYISWDDCFMNMAYLIAQRSKDPNTQNGACIVDEDNIVIGLGYNGFPRGCSDDEFPWARTSQVDLLTERKYAYVVHAEANAIYNSSKQPKGCKLYATMFPCNECTKALIQNGIIEVIFDRDPYHNEPIWKASRKMLKKAGIKVRQYKAKKKLKLE